MGWTSLRSHALATRYDERVPSKRSGLSQQIAAHGLGAYAAIPDGFLFWDAYSLERAKPGQNASR